MARESKASKIERGKVVTEAMAQRYPGLDGYLYFETPFQLVIATLLSAQTTDKAVNKVAPTLFSKWPTPQAMAQADELEIQEVIHSLGFFKTKAKRCIECASALIELFDGVVPQYADELQRLPGVGRKTANVVLNDAFGISTGIAVDTHVKRIANRLGFSNSDDPSKVEVDLMNLFPQSDWRAINKRWIAFGREICDAKKPKCDECFLCDICPTIKKAKRQ